MINNAAIYSSGGRVKSFNGRTGEVVPEAGDYTAEMVGAVADKDAEILGSLNVYTGNNIFSVTESIISYGNNINNDFGEQVEPGFLSCAIGQNVISSGNYSFAQGTSSVASGDSSVAFAGGKASGNRSFSFGQNSSAEGIDSFSINSGVAKGSDSFASGFYSEASGKGAHSEGGIYGQASIASGDSSHAEGASSAIGNCAHAEGGYCVADAWSHAEGLSSKVEGATMSHAEGYGAKVENGAQGAHARGWDTVAKADASSATGTWTIAAAQDQTTMGRYNIESSNDTDVLIIGNGSASVETGFLRSNCFRITTNDGVFSNGSYKSSGADYAEMFQWEDGNPNKEDRAGMFVTLDGEFIRLASPDDDFVLGIVSGNPSILADVYDDQWHGLYLRDVFGRPIMERIENPSEEVFNGIKLNPRIYMAGKVNPEYNSNEKYIPRSQRPEWDAVGIMGKLVAVDDGTCEVNGWCKVGEGGIATESKDRTKYRVMSRLDNNHIRILIL